MTDWGHVTLKQRKEYGDASVGRYQIYVTHVQEHFDLHQLQVSSKQRPQRQLKSAFFSFLHISSFYA